jgi:uncharacterized protein YbjQ (UPF0145 family)
MKRIYCAIALVAGSISFVAAQGSAGPRIYQVGEITFDRYTVLERIWVDSWQAAFDVPTRANEEAAIEALKEQAARRGADGIVNLHCLNDSGGLFSGAGHFCYANAIKLK